MTWGDTYNRHKAKGMDANDAAFRADQSEARKQEPFPQPRRNEDGEPCGECRIQPGETCDICGASNPERPIPTEAPPVESQAAEIAILRETQMGGSDDPYWCISGKLYPRYKTFGKTIETSLASLERHIREAIEEHGESPRFSWIEKDARDIRAALAAEGSAE